VNRVIIAEEMDAAYVSAEEGQRITLPAATSGGGKNE
jgi:hypothetical protein